MKLFLSIIAAILAPAFLISAWYLYGQFTIFESNDPYIWVRTKKFIISSLVISSGHVLLLGLPVFLLMRWANIVRWWSTVAVGFVLGAIPIAIYTWPVHSKGNFTASVNGIATVINGVPTQEGWLQYAYSFSYMGLLGAMSALAFWLVWRS